MIYVCTASPDSNLIEAFRGWVEAEWGEVDPFVSKSGDVLPAPILALKDGALVGGLSYTYSSVPGTQQVALWINTLLVAPEFRRMGIGSRLIRAAESEVELVGGTELYVFTKFAEIYQKLGWLVHSNIGDSTVLKKKFLRD